MGHLLRRVAVLGACLLVSSATQSQKPPRPEDVVRPILEFYDQGRYADALAMLDRVPDLPSDDDFVTPRSAPSTTAPARVAVQPVTRFTRGFENTALSWINDAPVERRPRRLRVAAVVALEVAAAFGVQQMTPAIEQLCQQFRKQPPTPFERTWQLASVAVAHAGGGAEFLVRQRDGADHLAHAVGRFPDEPRYVLAAAINQGVTRLVNNRPGISPIGMVRRNDVPDNASALKFIDKVLADLDRASQLPAVQAEARLRAGVIRFQLNRLDVALADLTKAEASADPFIRYMANLFKGLTLDAQGRGDLALDAYRAAHAADPTGQAASLQLAASLFVNGRRDEAAAVAGAAVPRPMAGDWWHVYNWGDYRFWPAYRTELRTAIDR